MIRDRVNWFIQCTHHLHNISLLLLFLSLTLPQSVVTLPLPLYPQVTDGSVFKTQMYKMSMVQELREARSSQASKLSICVSLCGCLNSSHCYLLWCLFSSFCFLGSPLLLLSFPNLWFMIPLALYISKRCTSDGPRDLAAL